MGSWHLSTFIEAAKGVVRLEALKAELGGCMWGWVKGWAVGCVNREASSHNLISFHLTAPIGDGDEQDEREVGRATDGRRGINGNY